MNNKRKRKKKKEVYRCKNRKKKKQEATGRIIKVQSWLQGKTVIPYLKNN
jgi:hypothetical protein